MTKQLIADISRRLDIVIRRGNTFEKEITVENEDGTPFDFTGYTGELVVVTNVDDRTPNLSFTAVNGLTLSEGKIKLYKTATQLKGFRDNSYMYFLKLTYPDSSVYLWLNGKFEVNEELYDNQQESLADLTIYLEGQPVILSIAAGGGPAGSTDSEYRGLYDPSSNNMPSTGGRGPGGAPKGGDRWAFSAPAPALIYDGEYWPVKSMAEALVDNPGNDPTKWRVW